MVLKICIFVIFFHLHLVAGNEDKLAAICEKHDHLHFYKNGNPVNCCNKKAISYGGKLFENWKECAVRATDKKDEHIIWTMWRIYVCLIKKSSSNSSNEKISTTELGKILSANYPEKMKEKISKRMNETIDKNGGKFVTEANFTDLANFDRLRQNYFTIEEEACGTKDFTKYLLPTNGKVWTACNDYEVLHRGGSCCQNLSIPFTDLHAFTADLAKCKTSLQPLSTKLKFNDTMLTKVLFQICFGSCVLMEKGKTEIDEVMKVNASTPIDYEALVQAFLPSYFSAGVHEKILEAVKRDVTSEKVSALIKIDLKARVGENIEQNVADLLHGCYTHSTVENHVKRLIDNICALSPSKTN